MKLNNVLLYLAVTLFTSAQLFAQETNPVVSNVDFSISDTIVTVTYDVFDAEQDTVTINMYVSSDGGNTWDYNYGTAMGDIGPNIPIGKGRTITWAYHSGYSNNFKIEITANDKTAGGSPCPGEATVTDSRDGHVYHTIQIGDQCWLKENMDIGTRINIDSNQTNDLKIEKYCYNDDETNCNTYGGLYQWGEAVQYKNGASDTTLPYPPFIGNVQGICPDGWHIPSYSDLQKLNLTVGNDGNSLSATGQNVNLQTNTSGFSALFTGEGMGGILYSFRNIYLETNFWSSTVYSRIYSYKLFVDWGGSDKLHPDGNYNAFSVRCIKN